jgi:hypothetical protein
MDALKYELRKMRQGDPCRARSEEGFLDEEELSQGMCWLKNPA